MKKQKQKHLGLEHEIIKKQIKGIHIRFSLHRGMTPVKNILMSSPNFSG